MRRYLRLYLYFLRFSFSKAMEFRVDFTFRIIMDLAFYTMQFLFFKIIYLHTPILGGWNLEEMRIFIGAFIFVDAFNMTFFANNAWWFPTYINRGELDYYLTKPISSFFFIGFREIAANSFINFLVSISLLAYLIGSSTLEFNFIKLIVFVFLLINGALLYHFLNLAFLMVVFWSHSPRGFGDLFFTAEKIMNRPDGIFHGYMRRFFLHILPFSIMASYPTRFLINENSWHLLPEILLTSLGVYFFVFFLWKKGLKSYSSASS